MKALQDTVTLFQTCGALTRMTNLAYHPASIFIKINFINKIPFFNMIFFSNLVCAIKQFINQNSTYGKTFAREPFVKDLNVAIQLFRGRTDHLQCISILDLWIANWLLFKDVIMMVWTLKYYCVRIFYPSKRLQLS